MDGMGADWELMGYFKTEEPPGSGIPRGLDLRRISLALRNGRLFVRAETDAAPPALGSTIFDLLVDENADGRPEHELAFNLSDTALPWRYEDATKGSINDRRFEAGRNSCVELAVPAELLPQGPFRVLPVFYDQEKEMNADEWHGWISIDPSALAAVERYGLRTDLAGQDTDSDGIPDVEEIANALDPTVRDNAAAVARLGPFVDGRDADWSGRSADTIMDTEDSGSLPPANDLASISWLVKNGSLFVLARTRAPVRASTDVMFDILVDLDGDGKADRDFAFLTSNPAAPWMYRNSPAGSSSPPGLAAAMGDVVEMRIPLSVIGNPAGFRILPIIRDMRTSNNFDEMWPWIRVKPGG
jgi:hypothetical protein